MSFMKIHSGKAVRTYVRTSFCA